jgi:ABC-type dipeptide/oligopeptide/nickel transport system ATPase component
MPPQSPILEVDNLAVSFDNRGGPRIQAVDGVRMSLYERQTLAVVGESGCGKSVTAMSALQLIPRPPGRFDRGKIHFQTESGNRVDLLSLPERDIRDIRGNEIAMIFQEPMTSLNPVETVGDQILEAITLHRKVTKAEARDIALESMNAVGIPDPAKRIRAYPHQFSGGMRQRVMIAMALACQPRLLLADEPTTALDVTIQAQILNLLTDLKSTRNLAVMLITHDLGVVAENADVVCVMYAGRVVEYAPVFELFDRPLHPYTRGLLACIPKMDARAERLRTIAELVNNPAEFQRLPDAAEGVRPWWPWHEPPADLRPLDGPAGEYALHRVDADHPHWVGVWRTDAITAEPGVVPRLPFRAADSAAKSPASP